MMNSRLLLLLGISLLFGKISCFTEEIENKTDNDIGVYIDLMWAKDQTFTLKPGEKMDVTWSLTGRCLNGFTITGLDGITAGFKIKCTGLCRQFTPIIDQEVIDKTKLETELKSLQSRFIQLKSINYASGDHTTPEELNQQKKMLEEYNTVKNQLAKTQAALDEFDQKIQELQSTLRDLQQKTDAESMHQAELLQERINASLKTGKLVKAFYVYRPFFNLFYKIYAQWPGIDGSTFAVSHYSGKKFEGCDMSKLQKKPYG
jgi:hypothetical protein